ncbi:hypothetical protein RK21_01430 [Pseudomonas plecoglossicida]|nr:hypothetical protein RK21_01430 [Pseudomonas plecoglossicida]
MVSPIVGAMPYTVGLAHIVIRLMIGFVVGLVVGTIICTIAPAAIMPTTIATVPAATAAVATTRATTAATATSTAMATAATATTTSAAMATTTAAASATTTVTATAATTTILRIRAGGTVNGVWHQHGRSRQHCTDSQSQQAFPEHHDASAWSRTGLHDAPCDFRPPMGRLANQRGLPSAVVERDPSGPAGQIFRDVS